MPSSKPIVLVGAGVAALAAAYMLLRPKKKTKGPFRSSVGIGRAEKEWADKNLVKKVCGTDRKYDEGERSEAPLPLGPEIESGDLSTATTQVDLLIVGARLSGAVIAERCAKELGMSSLIIETRDHIGGNCYDYVESHGLRASKYGAHLFHTQFERVWEYVQQWSEWIPFDHRVRGMVPDLNGDKKLVAIPPVQSTVNELFSEKIESDE